MAKPAGKIRRGINAFGRGLLRAGKATVRGVNVARGQQLTQKTLRMIKAGTFKSKYRTASVLDDGNISVMSKDGPVVRQDFYNANGRWLGEINKDTKTGMVWSQQLPRGK
ncbi:MAG: hypothetical protein V1777_04315 [Candidatus Micrarchaeota archaeon]